METSQPLPIVLALTSLLDGLMDAVVLRYGRFPIRGPLVLFLWKRFDRIKRRFATIAARFAAGKAFRARPPRPRSAAATRPRKPDDEHTFRLTTWVNPKFGWLCRIASESIGAGAFAYVLRDLLKNDPEMLALLAATPATARLLRPLCHMLGVALPPPVVVVAADCGPSAAPTRADEGERSSGIPAVPRSTAVVPEPARAEEPAPDLPADASLSTFFRAA